MQLTFDYIQQVTRTWLEHGGSGKVELAALEPLLWRDGPYQLPDLVVELKRLGCQVSLTTNGSLLARHVSALKQAGVDLVRLSWHTLDPQTFRQITGRDAYGKFIDGLEQAIDAQLPLAINRVLLRGHCDDLQRQIEFVDRHQLRLKLLDLYWMPSMADEYERFYISPAKALADHVNPDYLALEGRLHQPGTCRGRFRYRTPQNGIVEYKLADEAGKSHPQCHGCSQRANCLEGFGDYLRVFPDQSVSLCYLRKDLAHPLPSAETASLPDWLTCQQMSNQMPLRLVLIGQCNFNCGFPGSERSWCLKQGHGFTFPPRQGVIHVQAA